MEVGALPPRHLLLASWTASNMVRDPPGQWKLEDPSPCPSGFLSPTIWLHTENPKEAVGSFLLELIQVHKWWV